MYLFLYRTRRLAKEAEFIEVDVMIICLTGMPGSGKSEASLILKKHGFEIIEMRDIVISMMKEENIEVNVRSLEEFAKRIRKERGEDVVAEELVARMKDRENNIAIVGLRGMGELEYFKTKMSDIHVVALVADREVRFERLKISKKDSLGSYADFELREINNAKNLGVDATVKHAEFYIFNNSTKEDLERSVEDLFLALEKKEKERESGNL